MNYNAPGASGMQHHAGASSNMYPHRPNPPSGGGFPPQQSAGNAGTRQQRPASPGTWTGSRPNSGPANSPWAGPQRPASPSHWQHSGPPPPDPQKGSSANINGPTPVWSQPQQSGTATRHPLMPNTAPRSLQHAPRPQQPGTTTHIRSSSPLPQGLRPSSIVPSPSPVVHPSSGGSAASPSSPMAPQTYPRNLQQSSSNGGAGAIQLSALEQQQWSAPQAASVTQQMLWQQQQQQQVAPSYMRQSNVSVNPSQMQSDPRRLTPPAPQHTRNMEAETVSGSGSPRPTSMQPAGSTVHRELGPESLSASAPLHPIIAREGLTTDFLRSSAAALLQVGNAMLSRNAKTPAGSAKKFVIAESDVLRINRAAQALLLSQPTLVQIDAPVTIAGDLHGQYRDLIRLLRVVGTPSAASRFVFLGDYVDRGDHSLETIVLLLCYKLLFPNDMVLLRGNHEAANITRMYGFFDECKRRFNVKVWKSFVEVFNSMPLAAVVSSRIFCCHGGLSPDLDHVGDIFRIARPADVPTQGVGLDLLWADPCDQIPGWQPNDVRGVSVKFGGGALDAFLEQHRFDMVARGHEVVEEGYKFFHGRKLVTIFTAPNYCNQFENLGAAMIISSQLRCSFQLIEPLGGTKAPRSGTVTRSTNGSSASGKTFAGSGRSASPFPRRHADDDWDRAFGSLPGSPTAGPKDSGFSAGDPGDCAGSVSASHAQSHTQSHAQSHTSDPNANPFLPNSGGQSVYRRPASATSSTLTRNQVPPSGNQRQSLDTSSTLTRNQRQSLDTAGHMGSVTKDSKDKDTHRSGFKDFFWSKRRSRTPGRAGSPAGTRTHSP